MNLQARLVLLLLLLVGLQVLLVLVVSATEQQQSQASCRGPSSVKGVVGSSGRGT
jgi:hypothetical protein